MMPIMFSFIVASRCYIDIYNNICTCNMEIEAILSMRICNGSHEEEEEGIVYGENTLKIYCILVGYFSK